MHENLRKNLLVIVDDWEALEVYESRLAPHFRVRVAGFGSEGIRMAQEERPDRIFLDLTFEDMTVSEACAKLRSDPKTQTIPLTVIVSENESTPERPGVFPLPKDQLVRRPYEFSKLLDQLKF